MGKAFDCSMSEARIKYKCSAACNAVLMLYLEITIAVLWISAQNTKNNKVETHTCSQGTTTCITTLKFE
jgi:hypothetical protein